MLANFQRLDLFGKNPQMHCSDFLQKNLSITDLPRELYTLIIHYYGQDSIDDLFSDNLSQNRCKLENFLYNEKLFLTLKSQNDIKVNHIYVKASEVNSLYINVLEMSLHSMSHIQKFTNLTSLTLGIHLGKKYNINFFNTELSQRIKKIMDQITPKKGKDNIS